MLGVYPVPSARVSPPHVALPHPRPVTDHAEASVLGLSLRLVLVRARRLVFFCAMVHPATRRLAAYEAAPDAVPHQALPAEGHVEAPRLVFALVAAAFKII